MRVRTALVVTAVGLVVASCGAQGGNVVGDGSYRALVPSSIQFAEVEADGIPGGFIPLREAGVVTIEMTINGDDVTVLLDGREVISRRIEERVVVRDSEGSGPFKGAKEVLVLGEEPLVLAGLTIDRPVLWPGSFEESPVVTVKSRNPDERGPAVSCGADERCLLLSSGVDPVGRYEDANNPELDENLIASIDVSETEIEFTLDSNERIRMSRDGESLTRSCGLSETFAWDVPAEVGLEMDDPVLVQAACPTMPGDVVLHIFERVDMPVLVSLDARFGGEWCHPSAACLMFVPAP